MPGTLGGEDTGVASSGGLAVLPKPIRETPLWVASAFGQGGDTGGAPQFLGRKIGAIGQDDVTVQAQTARGTVGLKCKAKTAESTPCGCDSYAQAEAGSNTSAASARAVEGGADLQARIAQSFDVAAQPAPIISVKGRFVRPQVGPSAAIHMASSTRSDSSYCSGSSQTPRVWFRFVTFASLNYDLMFTLPLSEAFNHESRPGIWGDAQGFCIEILTR